MFFSLLSKCVISFVGGAERGPGSICLDDFCEMVRNYQKKRPPPSYSKEDLKKAIDAVRKELLTLAAAARVFSIPYPTLFKQYKKQRGVKSTTGGRRTVFTREEEEKFTKSVQAMNKWDNDADSGSETPIRMVDDDNAEVTFTEPITVAVRHLPPHLQTKSLTDWSAEEIHSALGMLSDDYISDDDDDDVGVAGLPFSSEDESDAEDTWAASTEGSNQEGLTGKWMQPLYYNFDTPISVELLLDVIKLVEKIGFKVRAFVCDMGPSNRKLMRNLNISWEKPSLKNPSDENRNVWGFCDVPHSLKLIRNHIIDDGFQLEDGNTVNKAAFEQLIETQSHGDLKYAHKVTLQHILVTGTERQNVRKAAELLSSTVGKAIIHNFPEFKHVGETVITINDGFDVLNSRVPVFSTNILNSAYGNSLPEQNNALVKLYELIRSMRALGKHGSPRSSLLLCQQGLLMSINSLKGLFGELKSDGYTYVMASRCNEDILESYFSKIRGLGKFYDHPTPTAVSQRIKTLMPTRHAHKRTTTQLRKLWENIKSRRKGLLNEEKRSQFKTGGGSGPREIPDDPELVALGVDVEIRGAMDSDTARLSAGNPLVFQQRSPELMKVMKR
ncbi:hypothetical protein GE061_001056 [Apolygus lucorum]|uniref:HTH psq-type domain-containing protein n=1 Tax=Apolygus lucorum TaxID=248454 RepID=A0A8S9Y604_APOLU|nr:hypothetical protein GE061_001056 [Apolygus lucorum]